MGRQINRRHLRKPSGNMIVLVSGVTATLVIALIVFFYNYVRLLASQGQSKNAIEAAALAAASDLSRIVVNTPEYGYISLSDEAPIGKATAAGDQYYLPVRSINSIIATCRLENQLAIALQDQTLSALAQQDLANAQTAIGRLESGLADAIQPGHSAQDIYGNQVTPYTSAENAYKANDVHPGQQYVANSLVLSLGCLTKGIGTNIPVPQPTTMSGLQPAQMQNGYYLSDTPVPFGNGSSAYGSMNVVLAPIAQATRLVDPKTFTPQLSALPAKQQQMLAAVKVDATETIVDSQNPQGLVVHMVSCAVPANVYDTKPAPGALSISFPDGQIPDWQTPMQMLDDQQLAHGQVDLESAQPIGTGTIGDYPTPQPPAVSLTQLTSMNWMLPHNPNPAPADVARACIYDWVRRAGPQANLKSIISALNTNFNLPNPATKDWITLLSATATVPTNITKLVSGPQIPVGIMHIYKFNTDGTVAYSSKTITPYPYSVISQGQMYGEALKVFQSKTLKQLKFNNIQLPQLKGSPNVNGNVTIENQFDVYFRDEVRQPGTINGGWHGGEPLENPQVSFLKKKELPFGKNTIHDYIASLLHRGSTGELGGGGWGANPPAKGQGSIPLIGAQSDFCEKMTPPPGYNTYAVYPSPSNPVRPTYTTNGTAVDIRFRRQVKIDGQFKSYFSYYIVTDVGYLALED